MNLGTKTERAMAVMPSYSIAIDNGYYPISLICGDYTADPEVVRPVPLGLDPDEEVAWVNAGGERGGSRYYGGKTTEGAQKSELAFILNTKETIGDLPLVVYVSASRPFCLYEFEEAADAIVLGLGVSSNAVLSSRVRPCEIFVNKSTANIKNDLNCSHEGQLSQLPTGTMWWPKRKTGRLRTVTCSLSHT